jgi:hypothetical protein
MLSTAEIATGCFFMRFVATLPLVTASFSLGHIGKGNWVCAMLVERGCGIIAVESPEGWHWSYMAKASFTRVANCADLRKPTV